MKIKQTYVTLFTVFKKLPLAVRLAIPLVVFFVGAYSLIFFVPKQVEYAYQSEVCVSQFTLLPSVMRQTADSGFSIQYEELVFIEQTPVASLKVCFRPMHAPEGGQSQVSVAPWGGVLANKQFTLTVADPPVAQTADFIDQTVPVTQPLAITLDAVDELFGYTLSVADKSVECEQDDATLHCPIQSLNLPQGKTLETSLDRYFDEEHVERLAAGEIRTVTPTELIKTSLTDGETRFDVPKSFTFEFNKEISRAVVSLKEQGDDGKTIATAISVEGKKVIVSLADDLARRTGFELALKEVKAIDGSKLSGTQSFQFSTSGGPTIANVSVGSWGVAPSGTIVLSFDQPIENPQQASSFVSVSGMNASVSADSNHIYISYSADTCVSFRMTVNAGFVGSNGVTADDSWSFESRTRCYTIQSFGASVQGRSLVSYTFGSGARTILFVGNIHGNEVGTRALLYSWIAELDANIGKIPHGTKIVVVPSANPDGYASGSRYNARGVDLNRNYDTSDWQSDVQTVSGGDLPGGGGSSPASEPETQALVNLTVSLRPALTLSYHSAAGYAIANTCGASWQQADQYARMVGYANMTGVSSAFSYQITGTYDDWMCERQGLPSVLVELTTHSYSEFYTHRPAMWAIVND